MVPSFHVTSIISANDLLGTQLYKCSTIPYHRSITAIKMVFLLVIWYKKKPSVTTIALYIIHHSVVSDFYWIFSCSARMKFVLPKTFLYTFKLSRIMLNTTKIQHRMNIEIKAKQIPRRAYMYQMHNWDSL